MHIILLLFYSIASFKVCPLSQYKDVFLVVCKYQKVEWVLGRRLQDVVLLRRAWAHRLQVLGRRLQNDRDIF